MATSHATGGNTCLFTGVPLPPGTKIEHTIPESLGGRIESRITSSDEFNNRSSSFDNVLRCVYLPLLQYLYPLLPADSRPAPLAIEIPGHQQGFVLDKGGIAAGKAIVVKDDAGKPTAAMAREKSWLEKFLSQQDMNPEQVSYVRVKPTNATEFYVNSPILSPHIEIAVLKSSLLTFDHMMASSAHCFTRHPDLQDVRELVRAAIDGRFRDANALAHVSLGLQYEKIALYEALRSKCSVPSTPFEHVLIASASNTSRTLDLVCLAFGFDPYGFRLCRSWDGDAFCYLIANPIIKGNSYNGPHELVVPDELLCGVTYRSGTRISALDETGRSDVLSLIAQQRTRAFGSAFEYIELNCDNFVIQWIKDYAFLTDPPARTLIDLLVYRLSRVFNRPNEDIQFFEDARRELNAHDDRLDDELSRRPVGTPEELSPAEWQRALAVYRRALLQLKTEYGAPGFFFSEYIKEGIEVSAKGLPALPKLG